MVHPYLFIAGPIACPRLEDLTKTPDAHLELVAVASFAPQPTPAPLLLATVITQILADRPKRQDDRLMRGDPFVLHNVPHTLA